MTDDELLTWTVRVDSRLRDAVAELIRERASYAREEARLIATVKRLETELCALRGDFPDVASDRGRPDIDSLRALISPVSHLRLEGGNVSIGADGLGGVLEWFSTGEDRPDVMIAIAAACNAVPSLLDYIASLESPSRRRVAPVPTLPRGREAGRDGEVSR